VMPMIQGKSLAAIMRNDPIPMEHVLDVARQICDGLEAAHNIGLVHRDLTPSNVLVDRRPGPTYHARVIDFGMAKDLNDTGQPDLTQTGQVLGTPLYMAPELINEEAWDHRVDVYALGVLMFKGLTGRAPFRGGAAALVMISKLRDQPMCLSEVEGGERFPRLLEQLLQACLATKPSDRPQNMGVVREVLDVLLRHLDQPDSIPSELHLVGGQVVWPDLPAEPDITLEASVEPHEQPVPEQTLSPSRAAALEEAARGAHEMLWMAAAFAFSMGLLLGLVLSWV